VGQFELRNLLPGIDDFSNYLNWMKDEGNKFIESVRQNWSIQELTSFVDECNSLNSCVLLGIFEGNNHIGNIKIDQIDIAKKSAWIGILIGSRTHRGIGLGHTVMTNTTKKFYELFNIENFFLGVDIQNLPAIKSYEKSGFSFYINHEKQDAIIMHKKEGGLIT